MTQEQLRIVAEIKALRSSPGMPMSRGGAIHARMKQLLDAGYTAEQIETAIAEN